MVTQSCEQGGHGLLFLIPAVSYAKFAVAVNIVPICLMQACQTHRQHDQWLSYIYFVVIKFS